MQQAKLNNVQLRSIPTSKGTKGQQSLLVHVGIGICSFVIGLWHRWPVGLSKLVRKETSAFEISIASSQGLLDELQINKLSYLSNSMCGGIFCGFAHGYWEVGSTIQLEVVPRRRVTRGLKISYDKGEGRELRTPNF